MLLLHNSGSGLDLARNANVAALRYKKWKSGHKQPMVKGDPLKVFVNWGIRAGGVRAILPYAIRVAGEKPVLNADNELAVSKVKSYIAFKEAGIDCPRLFDSADAATNSGVAFLGRADGLHSGMGIAQYSAGAVPDKHDFYVEALTRRHELRIHVFCDTVLVTQYKKVAPGGGLIGNYQFGARYLIWPLAGYLGPKTTAKATEAALLAVKALNLDFGAVDLMVTEDKRIVVLEVNTAPGIGSEGLMKAYTDTLNMVRLP
jgi:hypothetical protein